ncbi:MAG: arylsulfatase [Fuerstiella sp.]
MVVTNSGVAEESGPNIPRNNSWSVVHQINLPRPKRAILAAVLLTCLFVTFNTASASTESGSRPNIVVIMSDDMGYSDIGCYGGEIRTPVLDHLAAEGLRFTQFYNTARCCPTRASLLTGLYPHQAGVGHMMSDNGYDGYRGDLNRNCRTIAEVLKPAGYGTYISGKWHVTKQVKPDGAKDNWPLQRGFERFYGTIHGAGSFYDPNSLTRDNTQISPMADPEYQPETYYYTDAISDHAVRFVREHHRQTPDRPLFMYVAYTAAHWPMHALPEDVARYQGRYDDGYGAIRESRLQRMKELGVVASDIGLSPQAEDWDKVRHREWEIRCMEVYAAMVDRMDQGIGRIVDSLKETNSLDNTLILFLQDNGGCAEGLGRTARKGLETRPEEALEAMAADELQVNMIPKKTRDGWPLIQGPGVMPGPADTYIAYGRGWANVSNTPFREYKHWVHEGGISTPLIAHWPAGIPRKGELEHQPGHLIDIMATCVDLAGADYPQESEGLRITPLEGRSLTPVFTGRTIEREALYWEHEGNRAVRVGDWKLVAKGVDGAWELYNIRRDRAEMQNLAAAEPARVRVLSALWHQYAEESMVLPLTPYYKNSGHTTFSKKKKFNLAGDAELERSRAPMVEGRPFRLTVRIAEPGDSGVIVAQGGSAAGYALYQKDGRLWFAVRRKGKLFSVSGDAPAEATTLDVSLAADGTVTVRAGDLTLLTGEVGGTLDTMPIDGLQVGKDLDGNVGDYAGDFPFDGQIERVRVSIDD